MGTPCGLLMLLTLGSPHHGEGAPQQTAATEPGGAVPSPYPVPSPRAFKPPRERSYWAAAAAAGALTVFDMEASLGRKSRCGAACQEANPVLRPFLRKGRLAAYSYQSLIGAAFGYAAWKARQSRHPAIRKAWWVPFLVLGWAHFVGGTLNATYEDGPAAARPRAP